MTFDPSNPYRRKSSLVASEAQRPRFKDVPPSKRDECMVHHFLENQRRRPAGTEASSRTTSLNSHISSQYFTHPAYSSAQAQFGGDGNGSSKMLSAASAAQDGNGRRSFKCVVEEPSSPSNRTEGQPDQQAWTSEMTKSISELDLTHYEDVHSRMLSKKQLSDMAWGVRELSRRLSTMRIRFHVRSVLLLTKINDRDLLPKTRELTRWLLHPDRDTPYIVYLEDTLRTSRRFDVEGLLAEAAQDYVGRQQSATKTWTHDAALASIRDRLRYWDERMCRQRPHTFDFVITLGGDGTVLYASWLFQRIVPPVLSFSLGSLGFLTKFDFDTFAPTLTSVFQSGVTVSLRLRFEGTIMRSQPIHDTSNADAAAADSSSSLSDGNGATDAHRHREQRDLVEELIGEEKEDVRTHKPGETYEILNEIVVDRGPNPSKHRERETTTRIIEADLPLLAMSSTELFGDDEHFTSIQADGICVSTPTGSTAYNLAGGGSLCHPENPVMLVTSICPHTLSFRPIILPDTMVLRVGVPYDARTSSWASFDGRERVELHPGDYVTISASRYPFASVQAEGRRSEDWINSISGKLGWNTRQKQKGFKEWDK